MNIFTIKMLLTLLKNNKNILFLIFLVIIYHNKIDTNLNTNTLTIPKNFKKILKIYVKISEKINWKLINPLYIMCLITDDLNDEAKINELIEYYRDKIGQLEYFNKKCISNKRLIQTYLDITDNEININIIKEILELYNYTIEIYDSINIGLKK